MKRTIRERNILFLCEDNAGLSQMTEAAARPLASTNTRIFSAGLSPSKIPLQVYKVMEELGSSMSGQSSKGLTEIPMDEIDFVLSFDDADRQCRALPPKAKIERWSIPNPSRADSGSAVLLSIFRAGRDVVDRRVFALFLDHWGNVA